jgi:hypothetical protein
LYCVSIITFKIANIPSLVFSYSFSKVSKADLEMAEQQAAQLAFMAALGRIGFAPPVQQEIVAYTGCANITMLGLLTPEDITKMCKVFRTRAANPIQITVVQEQLLLAVRFWVANRQRLQKPVEPNAVNGVLAYNQAQMMRHMLEDEARADKEQTAKMPEKFKTPSQWRIFAEAMETYFSHLRGSGRIPLHYVIRKNTVPTPNAVYDTELEENIAIAPLVGNDFQRDNNRVYGIIKQLVLEGPGRSYILPFDKTSDGRAAWLSLTAHFEGESYRNRNVEEAYATLESLHYEGEQRGFTFEKFVKKHNKAYLELERYGEPVLETKKVRDFIRRINSPELTAAVQQVKANPIYLADFQQTVNYIALSVTQVKPSHRNIGAVEQVQQGARQNPTQPYREITLDARSNASSLTNSTRYRPPIQGGRGYRLPASTYAFSHAYGHRAPSAGRVQTHGRGRGGRGPGYYSPQQWSTLTPQQRDRILTQRGTKRNVSAISTEGQEYNAETDYTYDNSLQEDKYEQQWNEHEPYPDNEFYAELGSIPIDNYNEQDQGGRAGNEFGQRSHNVQSHQDDERYIGMLHSLSRMINNDCQLTMNVSQIITSETKVGHLELDSHADTCTAGMNARVLAYTNKICEVSPYHPQYKAVQNVPIAQVGVAYTHPDTGTTFILVLNQALYVKELPHTLINPNQLRCHGIIVDDCPRHLSPDPEKAKHSIFMPEYDLRLPLAMKGILSYLPVRYPTDKELDSCQWIELTSDKEWDPHAQDYAEKERLVDIAADTPIHDRIIASFNSSSSNPLELYQHVNPDHIQVAVTESHTRRYAISPEKLASKWNIGLDTAKRTLDATTQLAI